MNQINVKAIRRSAGLTQKQLAERLGIGTHAVSSWEQGIRSPSGPSRVLLEMIRRAAMKRESK